MLGWYLCNANHPTATGYTRLASPTGTQLHTENVIMTGSALPASLLVSYSDQFGLEKYGLQGGKSILDHEKFLSQIIY